MGNWDRQANRNRDVLERIVALMFALAHMADLASGLPYRRRRHVLGILGQGEAEAWAFVMGLSPGMVAPAEALDETGDAARLAASFRALALMLCALLARAALPGAAGPQAGRPSHGIFGPAGRRLPARAPLAPDTS